MVISNNTTGSFPNVRMRRKRGTAWIRKITAETIVCVDDLILPLFVQEGEGERTKIDSMPGVYRLSKDLLLKKAKKAFDAGIPAIALFPVVPLSKKTEKAEEAYNQNNLICNTVKMLKKELPGLGVICDVALDPYTSHGQDGLVKDNKILNDKTIEILCKQALSLAKVGADVVAPSDMMDGRVGAIREFLDSKKFTDVAIISYAAKYASSFYGPFRDAVGSAKNLGASDKKTYQMDAANSDEALCEVALDIAEGADMVMVKPGMPYLDIVRRVKDEFKIPVLAYQVSGEYAMIRAAGANGWLDEKQAFYESMLAFKRAGASAIFTYAALEVATILKERK